MAAKQQGQGQALGGGLFAQIERGAGGSRVVLAGNVTELAVLKPLLSVGNKIDIDLQAVDRINSLGVRHWVHFVRDAEAAGIALSFDRVSPVMIQQLGMISSFFGTRSKVRSLFVPYFCASCNNDALQLAEVGSDGAIAIQPTIPCPKCKSPMQIDELEEMYESLSGMLKGR